MKNKNKTKQQQQHNKKARASFIHDALLVVYEDESRIQNTTNQRRFEFL